MENLKDFATIALLNAAIVGLVGAGIALASFLAG
jgi:hypothetical protein